MIKWLLLVAAITLEVTATLSLRAALDHSAWYVVVTFGYVSSILTLSLVLRAGLTIGVAYGIWGASGVALTSIFAAHFFGDPLTPLMVLGITLVMIGVLCIQLGHSASDNQSRDKAVDT